MATIEDLRQDPGSTRIYLLELTALRRSDKQPLALYFSTAPYAAEVTPGTWVDFEPYLDLASLSVVLSAADEDATGGPAGLDVSAAKLLNDELFGVRQLDYLRDYELSGRAATLSTVGTTSSGDELTYANRHQRHFETGARPRFGRAITIPLTPATSFNLLEPANGLYKGLGLALLFNGSANVLVSGWSPAGSFSFQVFANLSAALVPGLADEYLIDKRTVSIRWKRDSDGRGRAVLKVIVGGAVKEATSAAVDPERFYFLQGTYDASSGVLECWIDDGETSSTSGAPVAQAPDVDGSALRFGSAHDAASGHYVGIACQWRIFDAAVARQTLLGYQSGQLVGDEPSLAGLWRGDTNTTVTKLYDYGPAQTDPVTPASPLDGTITNGVAAHSMEGGSGLRGKPRPLVLGYGDNAPGQSVAPQFLCFQFTGGSAQGFNALAEGAALLTREATYLRLVDLFLNPPTASGKYTYHPPSTTAMLFERVEGLPINGSFWGEGPYPLSLRVNPAASEYVEFSAASTAGYFNPTFDSAAYTWMAWIHLLSDKNYASFLQAEHTRVGYLSNNLRPFRVWFGRTYRPTGTEPTVVDIFSKIRHLKEGERVSPFHVAATGTLSGGNLTIKLFINGEEVSTLTAAAPGAHTTAPRVGFTSDEDATFRISEMALLNKALTEDEIRDLFLRRSIPLSTPGLVGYWPGSPEMGSTWYDVTGTGNHGTISGAVWRAGVAPASTHATISHLLERAGVAPGDLDLSRFWGASQAPISTAASELENGSVVRVKFLDLLSEALESTNSFLVYNPSAGSAGGWVALQFDTSGTAIGTLEAWRNAGGAAELDWDRPPHEILVGWGRVLQPLRDADIVPALPADEPRRAYLREPLRFASRSAGDPELYRLAAPELVIGARFVFEKDAVLEAERQAATRKEPLRYWSVPLARGEVSILPAEFYNIEDPIFPGGVGKFLILRVEDRFQSANVRALGPLP